MLDVALLIGRSESGKTTLAKSLLGKQEKPVRVVNDSTGELDPSWESCNWSDLERLENVAVLVEDVVAATPAEFAQLQRLLSVGCHHRSVGPVYILCHSLQKNNLQGLVQYLNRIIFTSSKTNVDSIATALTLTRFPKQTREEYTKVFLACKEPFAYFTLDLDDRTFSRGPLLENRPLARSSGGGEGEVSRESKKASREPTVRKVEAARFFQQMSDPQRAELLFDMLLPHLGSISVDYTVKMRSRRTGVTVMVSLLDYIEVATSENRKPNEALKSFHKYLRGILSVPMCLVVNKHLQQ